MPDNTGAHREGILMQGVERINHMQPEFVVGIGDMIEGYTEDSTLIRKQWTEFQGSISQLKMPFFYVPGNHDYSNQMMANFWQTRFGSDYYYFIYRNVLFLCLNSEDGTTSFAKADVGDKQYSFVEKVLSEHPGVDWTMVFIHQPLWLNPGAKNWLKVEKLLSDRKHSVFTGH
ncbi:MAG: metallophosphoesterase, partial [Prolixibacteraceae bacterium]